VPELRFLADVHILEDARPLLVTRRVLDVVREMAEELSLGAIVSVDETIARYRRLPIGTDLA
jgi:hypothetical protein